MSRKRRRILTAALCALALAVTNTAALAEAADAPVAEPELDTHTVAYLVREPVSGVWITYLSEQVRDGYLAKSAARGLMNPAGVDTEVFIGWYEDEEGTVGPVNLLRTPVTADMRLHAQFGDPADAVQLEGIALKITLVGSADGEEATLTAELDGVPEGVRYDLQWQNGQSGAFEDVPGENGPSITLPLAGEDIPSEWRIRVAF